MSSSRRLRAGAIGLGLGLAVGTAAWAQTPAGTAFTYQGRLTDGGSPADGAYDVQFVLFAASAGGTQVGPVLVQEDVAISGGLFSVSLDFGAGIFTGDARWLEVGVRPGTSTGAFTLVGPRQELQPSPHAVFSATAPWSGLTLVPPGFADGVDDDSGGDVTGVAAGAGLVGGGASGDLTLDVDFTGSSGSANASARSDHHHLTQTWNNPAGSGLTINSGGTALNGESSVGTAVIGHSVSAAGVTNGVWGRNLSTNGRGVYGQAFASSGTTYGIYGTAASPDGTGVYGRHLATTGTEAGVTGETDSASGGRGIVGRAFGVYGVGVQAESLGFAGRGVSALVSATTGTSYAVFGENDSSGGTALLGVAFADTGSTFGVRGQSDSVAGTALQGLATSPTGTTYGVHAISYSPAGYAGYFSGRVHVTGTLSKGGGAFKIDHPLDPEGKYLYHSFVESPDMKNIYDGVVVTGAAGYATVELPAWFEALNRDFRYQLTVIGQFAQAIVAEEVADNRFVIQSDKAGVKVSWQVTGIRKDAFAEKHRIPVEEDKTEAERGKYLYPEAHGLPVQRGIDYARRPRPMERGAEGPALR